MGHLPLALATAGDPRSGRSKRPGAVVAELLPPGQDPAAVGLPAPEQLRDGGRPGTVDHRRLLRVRRARLRHHRGAQGHARAGHHGQRRAARRGFGGEVRLSARGRQVRLLQPARIRADAAGIQQPGPRPVVLRPRTRRRQERGHARGASQQLAERLQPVQQPAERAQRGRLVRSRGHPDEHDTLCGGNRLRVPVERPEQLRGAVRAARRRFESRTGTARVPVPAERLRDARVPDQRVRLWRAVRAELRGRPGRYATSREPHPQHAVPARAERAARQR